MKKILVASLNWGLGHATRCIPIIDALRDEGFQVLIASDGPALQLLKKEFPQMESLELPSYGIQYPSAARLFKWKIIWTLPQIYRAMLVEEKIVANLVKRGKIDGIISDGRFGARNPEIPSVYITHQLTVFTGSTTWFSTRLHRQIIKKFDVCWVPDVKDMALNYSGKLGHLKDSIFSVRYFGIVSRLKIQKQPIRIDILALISGPEPQRTFLEKKLLIELAKTDKVVVLVRGVVEEVQKWSECNHIKVVNFMQGQELQATINCSEYIISRSGYTTIMDLAILEKKVFFIPTPGQYEQEYLAKRLSEMGIAPFCSQKEFKLERLTQVTVYPGLKHYSHSSEDIQALFSVFHRKGEF